jgi:hypothetical protein
MVLVLLQPEKVNPPQAITAIKNATNYVKSEKEWSLQRE